MRKFHTFFTAKAATGIGDYAACGSYEKLIIAVDTTDTSTLTVKFQGSINQTAPDFTAAQSATNQWDYIEVVDLEDGSTIDGDTGITVTGATDHRMVQANVDGLTFLNVEVSAYTSGGVTAKSYMNNNY